MGEEKSRSLTRTEFEAVMKRASELAVSDPYDGQSTLDEAEVFRIASEVGLPVAAALAFGGRRDCGCHGKSYRSLFHESTGGGSARTGGGARSVGAG